jgi:hypothetical protein
MAGAIVVSPREADAEASIPRRDAFSGDYKNGSLFLICTPAWFTTNSELMDLYQPYWSFGRAN